MYDLSDEGKVRIPNRIFCADNDPLCNSGGSMVLYNCAGDPLATIDVSNFTNLVKIDSILYSCEE